MLYNFAPCVAFMKTHDITVTRMSNTVTDFHVVAGTPTTFTIIANVHPIKAKIGKPTEGNYAGYDVEFQTTTLLIPDDHVSVDGKSYQIGDVQNHMAQGGFCIALGRGVN
jgi:hypothetical protein